MHGYGFGREAVAAEYVSGVADRTPAAQNITSRFTGGPHVLGRERHVMRASALEIVTGDFTFAGGHVQKLFFRRVQNAGSGRQYKDKG
jgi:hypothetical protein